MAIFLTILKIIGIVLLCIIGLIIFILLYVILSPFWFKIQGNIDREMNYNFKVKACTFLHFIQVHIDYYKDEGLNYNVSILGTLVKILPRKPKEEKNEDENNIDDKIDDDNITDTVNEVNESTEDDISSVAVEPVELDDIKDIDIHSSRIVDTESEEFEEIFSEEEKKFFVKVREFFAKFNPKDIIIKIKAKIEDLKKNVDKIMAIVFDEANKEWLSKILRELKKLIKSLRLNMRGTDLDFSLGSPDTTGQVSGALALFPPIYDKKVRIIPDFNDENLYFDGDIFIKGKLQIIHVLIFGLVILFDSNTKRIINSIKDKTERSNNQ